MSFRDPTEELLFGVLYLRIDDPELTASARGSFHKVSNLKTQQIVW